MGIRQKVKRNFGQFVRFGIVGGSGVVVNLIIAYILTQLHGGVSHDNDVVFDLPGNFAVRFTIVVWVVSFMIANVWNYQLNRMWTFNNVIHRSWWAEFWPFFAVGLVAAIAGIFIKWGLTNPTSPFYLPDPPFNDAQGIAARAYWAQLLTIIITMPINYLVNKVWTFKGVKTPTGRERVEAQTVDLDSKLTEQNADLDQAVSPDSQTLAGNDKNSGLSAHVDQSISDAVAQKE